MQCGWHLSSSEAASLFTAVFLGKALGEPVWGSLSDTFGRRPVIIALACTTAVGAASSALAPSFRTFIALRLLFGFTLPVDNVIVVWLLEILPAELRGLLGAALGVCWVAASFTAVTAGSWLLEPFGWRSLVIFAAIPAVLSAFISLAIPESPAWLSSRTDRQHGRYRSTGWSHEADEEHTEAEPLLLRPPQERAAGDPWRILCSRWGLAALSLALTALMGIGQASAGLLPQQAAAVASTAQAAPTSGLSCTSGERGAHLALPGEAYRGLALDALGGLPLSTAGLTQALAVATWLPLLALRGAGAGTPWLTA
eukprot:CAMPEP_0177612772 /NCGR_PEP_ID=MMETSP0419_2-20121207/21486_1 /TAXON_ID=582737 /ORGANISM="Tetraselmis sp., Strain GSL018" /LENGTH=311 /DNA_ID=CAMNT_0019109157 /DNA_START=210 /DNA_END=1141 /DNA_ORIENTATION=-